MRHLGIGVGVVTCMLSAAVARADERKFTYSYEANTLPAGAWEFEQWATLHSDKGVGSYRSWAFREEVEYGVRDDLTTALYLNWEYEAFSGIPGVKNEHEVEVETLSSEWKWKLTDPTIDPVGTLLYGEVAFGEEFELELKGVASKNVGDFVFAYNLIFEIEWEEEKEPNGKTEWEREFVLSHALGASYRIAPGFHAGLEAVSHTDFEESLNHSEHTAYFAGPNVHYAWGAGWATLTVLKQLDLQEGRGLILDAHEKYEFRLILSLSF